MSMPITPQGMMVSESFRGEMDAALQRMAQEDWMGRIWSGDASLWNDAPDHAAVIAKSLGWLSLPERMKPVLPALREFADETRREIDRVVLLGMGGSSLAPWCFAETCGVQAGYPQLTVLDSTVPAEVLAATGDAPLQRCLFIAASKSGTTTETLAFFEHFRAGIEATVAEDSGRNFVIISDPGTSLVEVGREMRARAVFENWEDIGGRYSALSYFGMAPAALIGAPIDAMLEAAAEMAAACSADTPPAESPAAVLGAFLGCAHSAGRDKITLLPSSSIASLGDWIEQLLAESTGKEGVGLVPVVNEPILQPSAYGADRAFVQLRCEGDSSHDELAEALAAAGHPVMRIDIGDPCVLGGEMFRWEFATAVAGAMMQINPFDQPDVQSAKDRTREVLEYHAEAGELPQAEEGAGGEIGSDQTRRAVAELLARIKPGDYFAIMAYLPQTAGVDAGLAQIRRDVAVAKGVATTSGYGPRFLHSTGQLHKGGPDGGVFLQITSEGGETVEIPGASYDFATLKDGQAAGDLAALRASGRRVARVDLGGDMEGNLPRLAEMIANAL